MTEKSMQEKTQTMLNAFNDEFLLPYMEKCIDLEDSQAANLMIGFAASAFMRMVMPILLSNGSPKKAIDDVNGILNDIREQIKVIAKKITSEKLN